MVGYGIRMVTREDVAPYGVTIVASPQGSTSRNLNTSSLGVTDFPYASGDGSSRYEDISLTYKGGSNAPGALVVRTRDLTFYSVLPVGQTIGLKFLVGFNDFTSSIDGYGSLYFIDIMRDNDPGPNYSCSSIDNCTIYLFAKNLQGIYVNTVLSNNRITANTGNPSVGLSQSEISRLAANNYILGALVPGRFALFQGSKVVEASFIMYSTNPDPETSGTVVSYYIPKTGETSLLYKITSNPENISLISVNLNTAFPILRFYLLSPGQYTARLYDSGEQYTAELAYKRKQWEQQIADAGKILDLVQKGANIAKTVSETAKNATDIVGNIAKVAAL